MSQFLSDTVTVLFSVSVLYFFVGFCLTVNSKLNQSDRLVGCAESFLHLVETIEYDSVQTIEVQAITTPGNDPVKLLPDDRQTLKTIAAGLGIKNVSKTATARLQYILRRDYGYT